MNLDNIFISNEYPSNAKLYAENDNGVAQEFDCTIENTDLSSMSVSDTVLNFQDVINLSDTEYTFSMSFDGPMGKKTLNVLKSQMYLSQYNNYRKFHHKPMKRNRKYRCKVFHYCGIYKVEDKEYNVFIQVDRFNHCKIYKKDKYKCVNSRLTERY